MEMTLWESLALRVWESVTVDQLLPAERRGGRRPRCRSEVYQAAYW